MELSQAMLEAIALATDAMPHPNPRVGSVILDAGGDVVGRGFHRGPGTPHAEIVALSDAGKRVAGGTVVATLEPCDHHGRTPPCTEAIIRSKAARVVIGAVDPDRRVSGTGIAALRRAGLEVITGVETEAAEALDPGYFHHRRTGLPLVTLKVASTLDGQVAAADGSSKWITSEEARLDGHILRSRSDAVLVGAGTVMADDPGLDVRIDGYEGPQPRPVVVAGRRPLPVDAKVIRRDAIVFGPATANLPAEAICLPGSGGVDLTAMLRHLGDSGLVDLMVEGGPTLAGNLLAAGLVDRLVLYLAASLGGGTGRPAFAGTFETLSDAVPMEITSVTRIGPDLRVACTWRGA